MANEEHLKILKQGVEAWNAWRGDHLEIRADLRWAILRGAHLGRANLGEANLLGADLSRAHLSGADLSGADLSRANLAGADLSEAYLGGANLSEAYLGTANLSGAILYYTVFAANDLSAVKGLETVIHRGPSTIGIDTIFRSKGNIPESFPRGAGVPEDFIVYMKSLVGKAIEFYSCFISHSTRDQGFADRLYEGLKAKDVRCWYFPEDAKWGEPVWGRLTARLRSMTSWW